MSNSIMRREDSAAKMESWQKISSFLKKCNGSPGRTSTVTKDVPASAGFEQRTWTGPEWLPKNYPLPRTDLWD
jgi:hypothetical protein